MNEEFQFGDEVKSRIERGDFDTMQERLLRRLCEKPELLDRLIQSLQEEPKPWVDDDFIPYGEIDVEEKP